MIAGGEGIRVEVALPLPLDRTFTYLLPAGEGAGEGAGGGNGEGRGEGPGQRGGDHTGDGEGARDGAGRRDGKGIDPRAVPPALPPPGTRVLVPFQGKRRIGWITGPGTEGELPSIRPVLRTFGPGTAVPPELLRLARWMAEYYGTPLGVVLRTLLPAVLSDPGREAPQRPRQVARIARWVEGLEERDQLARKAPRQLACLSVLEAAGGEMEVAALDAAGYSRAVVRGLEGRGIVSIEERDLLRDPALREPAAWAGGPGSGAPPLEPTPLQAEAIGAMVGALDDPERRPFLLQGITGSGKTLVYIELLRRVLERGMGGIVLVPEIALTPQTVGRFRDAFGARIAVLHSGLSEGERWSEWRALRSGAKSIGVGARSALFAPIPRLGAVIVDEEHDGSYKQSEAPRYHARDLAVVRAAMEGAVCVLGSATPSLESWANAREGRYRRILLSERATGARLPEVRLVDLRTFRGGARQGPAGAGPAYGEGGVVLSPPLIEAITNRLERREQVILLLNRRGYSSFVQCRACGDVRSCPDCAVSLTLHRTSRRLLCHHCRHEAPLAPACERCGSTERSLRGIGTEQVERIVAERFPTARIARMDVDTTSGRGAHHEILGRVGRGEIDLLLGTQMIAKGLDFPRVTLVGVIDADTGLHLPDFRASERTFQLLSQVAGRAGRGSLGGEVLIQTSLPGHHALQCAITHDYERFAERELADRTVPAYPPTVRLANVVTSSPDPELAAGTAEAAARWIRGAGSTVELVGPAPSPIERLHGRWRWHFFLRTPRAGDLGALLRAFQRSFSPPAGDIRIAVDRDPVALL